MTVLLFAAVLFGLIIQLPVFFQTVLHTSPTVSGLMLIPLTLAQVAVSTVTGLRISRTGHPRTAMASSLSIVAVGFLALASGITLGQKFIVPLTFLIGAGLGSTMPSAQTMVQWAAGEKRLGVGTAVVSFSRTIGGVMGAALTSAVLLGVLQFMDPNARNILSRELASIGSSRMETTQIVPALVASYRWMFIALGTLSGVVPSWLGQFQTSIWPLVLSPAPRAPTQAVRYCSLLGLVLNRSATKRNPFESEDRKRAKSNCWSSPCDSYRL